jgi:penicillin-binding protein 2
VIEAPLQRRAPLPPQLTRRVGVLGVLALVLFGIIAFRLWYLQVLTGTQNAAKATANVTRDISIAPPRGNILDSQGQLLASYRVAPEVAIVADDLPPAGSQRRVLYRRLARVLGTRWQNIKAKVDNLAVAPPRYAPTAIKDDVTTYALDYIAERKQLFPGVVERQVYLRDYPQGDIGSVVFGQVGQITGPSPTSHGELGTPQYKGIPAGTTVGQSGLEAEYQPYLQGTPGVERIAVDAAGYPTGTQPSPTLPVPGDQLSTSIDLGLEREGYIALRKAEAWARVNHDPAPAASFVAVDPRTGRVLALGSLPTYDANAFATPPSFSQYAAIKAGGGLNDRATDGQYPTGSTFKPITALGALNAGVITPQTSQGNGACLTFGTKQQFCNSGQANYGNLDLASALTVSEDTYFYLVGAAANGAPWAIQTEARALGLGANPGIDLPGGGAHGVVPDAAYVAKLNAQFLATACAGNRPRPAYAGNALAITACAQHLYQEPWTIGQNILLATGQGFLLASPLQMAVAYSAIVNGGTVWTPQIGRAILSASGQLVQQLPPPTAVRHVAINATDQATVMAGLHAAAQSPHGTSYAVFGNFPRPVYGKTGTAVHTNQKDQSWYVVYAPDAKRPIVIAVTVEQGGFGAAAAAPAARLMLSQWFGLPKTFNPGTNPDR